MERTRSMSRVKSVRLHYSNLWRKRKNRRKRKNMEEPSDEPKKDESEEENDEISLEPDVQSSESEFLTIMDSLCDEKPEEDGEIFEDIPEPGIEEIFDDDECKESIDESMQIPPPCEAPPPDEEEPLTYLFFMRQCFLDCSAHGFPRILQSPTQIRKYVWSFFTLVSIGVCIYQCTVLLMDYLAYPTSLSMSIELQSSMEFPSVTICNMNKFRISTVEDIPDLRRIFLYELALKTSLEPIIESLQEHTVSSTNQKIFTWCTISPYSDSDEFLTIDRDNDTVLDREKNDDPDQLFYFNEITGAIVSNKSGYCLIEEKGVVVTRPKSCKEEDKIEWFVQEGADDPSVIAIFNAEGQAFEVKGNKIAVEAQDFSNEKQFFTRNCNGRSTDNDCLTQTGINCLFPAQDEKGAFHEDCSEKFHPLGLEFWCATGTPEEEDDRIPVEECNMEICKAEVFCATHYPDVFPFPYPGIGLVPPHYAGSLETSTSTSVASGASIASPINPYVGLVCAEYKYNDQSLEYELTEGFVCQYPSTPFVDLVNLDQLSTFSNYITCDGELDCLGGEDESLELCGVCPKTEFQCDNDDCIALNLRCDGFLHCRDGSDEFKKFCQPEDGMFACATSNDLVLPFRVCDGIIDCKRDLSDEIGIACDVKYNGANSGDSSLLACQKPDNGDWMALAKSKICDDVEDCMNGTDEMACWKEDLDTWIDPYDEINRITEEYFDTVRYTPDDVRFYRMASQNSTRLSGHEIGNMIVSCTFNNKPCDMNEAFHEVVSEQYGRCYQFNHNESVVRSGRGYGLDLLLNAELYEYTGSVTSSSGFAVYISPFTPSRYLDPSTMRPVHPGILTSISISRSELLRAKRPHGDCEDYSTKKYPFSNKKECLFICLQQRKMTECECSDNVEFDDYLCNVTEESKECIKSVETLFHPEESCSCPAECHYITIETDLEQSLWPNEKSAPFVLIQTHDTIKDDLGASYIIDSIVKYMNGTDKEEGLSKIRENYAHVIVYFDDLTLTKMESVPTYTFEGLVSSVGGLLGLWIGLSMLSICELFDVALDLWVLFLLKGKREKYKKLIHEEVLIEANPEPKRPITAQEKTLRELTSAPSQRSGNKGNKERSALLARANLLMAKSSTKVTDTPKPDPSLMLSASLAAATSVTSDEKPKSEEDARKVLLFAA